MAKTSIEWTDHSINAFRARDREGHVGHYCEKISAGCTHCYASGLQKRFQMPEYRADKREGIEVFLDESKLQEVLRRRVPTKYFWCDMTDMFLECYPFDWIDKCFAVMALTPQHTHQVLTKRPRRMLEYCRRLGRHNFVDPVSLAMKQMNSDRGAFYKLTPTGWCFPNIWLGVSVEDQKTADERVPLLLQTPAAVRWVSYEPALGSVDFDDLTVKEPKGEWHFSCLDNDSLEDDPDFHGAHIDWLVCGGESGHGARPMHPDWARSVRDQCVAAGVPFFFKQWGAWQNGSDVRCRPEITVYADGRACGFTREAIVAEEQRSGILHSGQDMCPVLMSRVGKKAAGRLLDGREWNQFPQ